MVLSSRTRVLLVAGLVLVFAIIHLGVGIALSIFNIVIGLIGIVVVAGSLVASFRQGSRLRKIAAICALVLGVFALASLIGALVLNAQAIGYVRERLSYRMNSYSSIDHSIDVMDDIQTRYECCGESLWLDWGRIALGPPNLTLTEPQSDSNSSSSGGAEKGSSDGSSSGSKVIIDSGSGGSTSIGGKVRRRESPQRESNPSLRAIRLRRDTNQIRSIYGLPSEYTLNLPLSCCKRGEAIMATTLSRFCVFNPSNSTKNFNVGGCLEPISNTVVSQITGIAVINVCLTILAFVFVMVLIHTSSSDKDADGKQLLQSGVQQPQELQATQNGEYTVDASVPNVYCNYSASTAPAPNYPPATYTVC